MASIDAAVALIGTQALGRLVLAGGVVVVVRRGSRDRPADLLARLADRRHRRQKLASRLGAEVEEAYVSGLLHGTGHLILCKTYPDIADFVFTGYAVVARRRAGGDRAENFGIDHPNVGASGSRRSAFPSRSPTRSATPPQPLPAAPARST
jgi:HD-like signal output (HDOD) protein